MSDFSIALIFGGVVIAVFAWDQFNRPSYERSLELTRLINLLSPAELRNGSAYFRAYLFYAGILLLIYATLCIYGSLPILETLGFSFSLTDGGGAIGAEELPIAGYSPELQAEAQVSDPTIPLVISLAIIGLGPSVPLLQRLEEKIRFAAHRLSGIPTRLVSGIHHLRRQRLNLRARDGGLMIPPQDWERMRRYEMKSAAAIDDVVDFMEDIEKIIAFRSWIVNERLQVSNLVARDGVAHVEALRYFPERGFLLSFFPSGCVRFSFFPLRFFPTFSHTLECTHLE